MQTIFRLPFRIVSLFAGHALGQHGSCLHERRLYGRWKSGLAMSFIINIVYGWAGGPVATAIALVAGLHRTLLRDPNKIQRCAAQATHAWLGGWASICPYQGDRESGQTSKETSDHDPGDGTTAEASTFAVRVEFGCRIVFDEPPIAVRARRQRRHSTWRRRRGRLRLPRRWQRWRRCRSGWKLGVRRE